MRSEVGISRWGLLAGVVLGPLFTLASAGGQEHLIESFSTTGACGWQTEAKGSNLEISYEGGVADDEDGKSALRMSFKLKNPNDAAGDKRWFFSLFKLVPQEDWVNAEALAVDVRCDFGDPSWTGPSLVCSDKTIWSRPIGWDGFKQTNGTQGRMPTKWTTVRFGFAELVSATTGATFDPTKLCGLRLGGGAFAQTIMFRNLRLIPKTGSVFSSPPFLAPGSAAETTADNPSNVFEPGRTAKLPLLVQGTVPSEVTQLAWSVTDVWGKEVRAGRVAVGSAAKELAVDVGVLPSGYYELAAFAVRNGVVEPRSAIRTTGSLPKGRYPFAVVPASMAECQARAVAEGESDFFGIQNCRDIYKAGELTGAPWRIEMPHFEWGMSDPKDAKPQPAHFYSVMSFVHRCKRRGVDYGCAELAKDGPKADEYFAWVEKAVRVNMACYPHMKRRPYELAWEEDLDFPPRGRLTMEALAAYWKKMYEVVKRTDPKAEIWGPKCTHSADFLERFLAAGLGEYVDAVSMHFYVGSEPDNFDFESDVARIRAICRKYVGRELPIHNTEGGFYKQPDVLTHASKIIRYAQLQKAAGIETFLLFYIFDHGKDEGVSWGLFYNPTEPADFSPKTIYPKAIVPAYATMSRLLTGAKLIRSLKSFNAGFNGFVWDTKGNGVVLSLWNPFKTETVTVPVGVVKSVQVVDLVGGERTVKAKDGQVELEVSPSPVYVLGADSALWSASAGIEAKEAKGLRELEVPGLKGGLVGGRPAFTRIPPAVAFEGVQAEACEGGVRLVARFRNVMQAQVETRVSIESRFGKETHPLSLGPGEGRELAFVIGTGKSGIDVTKRFEGRLVWRIGGIPYREDVALGFLRAYDECKAVERNPVFSDEVKLECGKVRFSRTKDAFRIHAEIADSVHYNEETDSWLWNADSLQLAFDTAPDYAYAYDKMIAQTKKKVSQLTVALNGGKVKVYRHVTFDEDILKKGLVDDTALFGTTIVHRENVTVYDIVLPWREIGLDPSEVKSGMKLGFALVVNRRDSRQDARRVCELFRGIHSGVAPRDYGSIVLE